MPPIFKKLEIPELIIIEPQVFFDDRGFFFESYKASEFIKNGIPGQFVQDNHSLSRKNVLRGLHYQKNPQAQGKLVRVIKGEVWDVMVDIRRESKTFMKWVSVILSEENRKMLFIPAGFAHGFVALSNDVHLVYKCTSEYSPELDSGIIWNDPGIKVDWPVKNPIISSKDNLLPLLKNAEIF